MGNRTSRKLSAALLNVAALTASTVVTEPIELTPQPESEPIVEQTTPPAIPTLIVVNDPPKPQRPVVKNISADDLQVTLSLPDGREVVAGPFRWGRKMLMKVEQLGEGVELSRGERVSIGQIAKKALTAAGLVLPAAELKRPRKVAANTPAEAGTAEVVEITIAASALVSENPVTEDLNDALGALLEDNVLETTEPVVGDSSPLDLELAEDELLAQG